MGFKLISIRTVKMDKSQNEGYFSGILSLAPSNVSGFEVCKHATKGCRSSIDKNGVISGGCLNTAGLHAGHDKSINNRIHQSRIRKTRMLFENRELFFSELIWDINALIRKGKKYNKKVSIRLNGFSDLPWELMGFEHKGTFYKNIMSMFPNIDFYDYTKYPVYHRSKLPKNYHLTFSLGESNSKEAMNALSHGMNVAVVFKVTRFKELPKTFWGFKVIDGDKNDLRFRDPKGVIVGLRAKGNLRKDESGFVVDPNLIEDYSFVKAAMDIAA